MTVVVCAEGSWSMEVPNEQMLYGQTFGTEMGTVRWDTVARGLGCEGFYAESVAELESALASARDVDGPAVICVRTDRAANLGVAPDPALRFAEDPVVSARNLNSSVGTPRTFSHAALKS